MIGRPTPTRVRENDRRADTFGRAGAGVLAAVLAAGGLVAAFAAAEKPAPNAAAAPAKAGPQASAPLPPLEKASWIWAGPYLRLIVVVQILAGT